MCGIGKFHAGLLMASDAQLRNIIRLANAKRRRNLFYGSAMGIVTGGAVHAALIMCAYLPILPAKARITMTASAQVRGTVYGHGSFGVIRWRWTMAGFTRHAISFIGCSGWIKTCGVAD